MLVTVRSVSYTHLDVYKRQHLGYSIIGTGLLWFGWFGFNAGSALGATNLAVSAMIVTNLAACVGMMTWILMDKLKTRCV